jgi:hypothetical protein
MYNDKNRLHSRIAKLGVWDFPRLYLPIKPPQNRTGPCWGSNGGPVYHFLEAGVLFVPRHERKNLNSHPTLVKVSHSKRLFEVIGFSITKRFLKFGTNSITQKAITRGYFIFRIIDVVTLI